MSELNKALEVIQAERASAEGGADGSLVISKTWLSANVCRMVLQAPHIAKQRKPGQFVIVQTDVDYGERVPLTIADADAEAGTITIIFQTVGKSTTELGQFEVGDYVPVCVGPMGKPTHIEKFGRVVAVGGGIGIAPLHPIVQGMKAAGNHVTLIAGARSKELIIMEEEMRKVVDDIIICTDDGSYGRKALVTEPLKEICENDKPDMVIAIGPLIMMKFCAETTRPFAVPTLVSMNPIMIDGTGMCGCCRVTVGGQVKFVCVDGPEFDGHLVDFNGMLRRLNAFKAEETCARERGCRRAALVKALEEMA